MAVNVKNIKGLAKRATGKGKAIKMAFQQGGKLAAEKAGKGTLTALVAGGAVGGLGTSLATGGKLALVVGKWRIPLYGTAVSVLTGFLAWFMRKRPAVWKPLVATSVAAATSQILDIAKFGFVVKSEAKKTEEPKK